MASSLRPDLSGKSDVIDTLAEVFGQYTTGNDDEDGDGMLMGGSVSEAGRGGGGMTSSLRGGSRRVNGAPDERAASPTPPRSTGSRLGAPTGNGSLPVPSESFHVSPLPQKGTAGPRQPPPGEAQYREIARLHDLWTKAKEELRERNADVADLKAKLAREATTSKVRQQQIEELEQLSYSSVDLKDRLRFSELHNNEIVEDNKRLKANYKEVVIKLQAAAKQLDAKVAREAELVRHVEEVETKLLKLESSRESVTSRHQVAVRHLESQLGTAEQELTACKTRADRLDQTVHRLQTERGQLQVQLETLTAEFNLSQRKVAELEGRLEASAAAVANAAKYEDVSRQAQAQLDHLKTDNARLIKLLSTTSEYKGFVAAAFPGDARSSFLAPPVAAAAAGREEYLGGRTEVDDSFVPGQQRKPKKKDRKTSASASALNASALNKSGHYYEFTGEGGGAVRPKFDPAAADAAAAPPLDVSATARDISNYSQMFGLDDGTPVLPDGESSHWVPTEVVEATAAFRRRHMQNVPVALIRTVVRFCISRHVTLSRADKFLLQLNGMWRQRYNSMAKELKGKYTSQISDLKRQLAQKQPYKAVAQQTIINRLQHDLASARKDAARAKARSDAPRDSMVGGKGDGLVEVSLATVEGLSRQVAEYAAQNKRLMASLRSQQALNQSAAQGTLSHLQSGFQQGLVWFGRQAMRVMDELGATVTDMSIAAQQQTLSSLNGLPPAATKVLRTQATWFPKFEDSVTDSKKKLRTMFESTLAAGSDAATFKEYLDDIRVADTPRMGTPEHSVDGDDDQFRSSSPELPSRSGVVPRAIHAWGTGDEDTDDDN